MMRTKTKPRFLTMSFSLVALLVLILSACGGASGPSSSGSGASGAPAKGGTWIDDLYEEPDSLIPNLSSETFAYMVQYGLYAPLVYGTPQGQLMPGIATEVPTVANNGVSADLKTVTFHLHPGLVWSDGQPLDARDVDYSWKLWANPKTAAYNTTPFVDIASADVSSDNLSITFLKDGQSGSSDSAWFLDVSKALAYTALNKYSTIADGGGTGTNSYSWEAIWINFNNKILGGNPEVRQAMSMAVDQQTLIQVARRGYASARCQDHPPVQVPGYSASLASPKFDLAAANALLDSKGWVKGADGVRSKNGQRLEFQYSTTAGNLWRSDDQLINQANFLKIGIKLDIMDYPASTFFGSLRPAGVPGRNDIGCFAESGSYDPDNSSILTCDEKGSGNLAFYCSQQMEALQKQQLSTGDTAARKTAFDGINQLEVTDVPFIVEFGAPDLAVYKKGTHNYLPSAVGVGSTENIWLWW